MHDNDVVDALRVSFYGILKSETFQRCYNSPKVIFFLNRSCVDSSTTGCWYFCLDTALLRDLRTADLLCICCLPVIFQETGWKLWTDEIIADPQVRFLS